MIDPRNLATDYGVSGLSNVTTQTSPDTGVTTRTFDAAGNVKTSRDARCAPPPTPTTRCIG